ncbi:MAG: hypothetical protein ACRD2G_12215 [Terriglobia bacterium]
MIKRLACSVFPVVFCAAALLASPKPAPARRTFTGNISDSACGLHHMMGGGAKQCTLECINMGAKFVLADEAHHKVYGLSDQAKAKQFAGQDVKVTGTLSHDTIRVASISAK